MIFVRFSRIQYRIADRYAFQLIAQVDNKFCRRRIFRTHLIGHSPIEFQFYRISGSQLGTVHNIFVIDLDFTACRFNCLYFIVIIFRNTAAFICQRRYRRRNNDHKRQDNR